MRQIIRIVGFVLFGLVVAGLCLDIGSALLAGKPFYGKNYKMLDLPTYSGALTVIVILGVGLCLAIQWTVRKVRHWRSR